MPSQVDIANEALAQVGTRSQLTSVDDDSAEALYVRRLYAPIRDFLLTDGDYDFSLGQDDLVLDTLMPAPWAYSYFYPSGGLRIRQVIPVEDYTLNPKPVEWNVLPIGSTKRIITRIACERVLYTLAANEDVWDAIFRQAMVRMLASALAFALENRIEASKVKLDEALGFAGIAKLRDP